MTIGLNSEITATTANRGLSCQLANDLMGGLSVLLTGLPRSGRSHLVRVIAAELAELGANVVFVRGNRMLAERPLAALAMADKKFEANQATQMGSALERAVKSFGALFDRPNSVLIVDDATELDRLSVGVIVDVRAQKSMSMLLVGEQDIIRDEVLTTLVTASQPGATVTLKGLTFEDVTQLTNCLLGGPVETNTISQIAILSGGLPGLIENIVQLARRNGRLEQRNGQWVAAGDLWDPALQFSLVPFTRGLDPEDLDCLSHLAYAEGITRAEAEEMVGAAQVAKLAQRGVLHVDEGVAIAGVHVFPVALAESLRCGRGTVDPGADRVQSSAISMGHWPVRQAALEATAVANRIRTTWRTELNQQWAHWTDDQTSDTAVPLLYALFSAGGDDDRIATVLAKTRRGSDQDAFSEFSFLAAGYRAIWQHDLPGALADLDRLRTDFPKTDSYVRGQQAYLRFLCDRVPEPAALEQRATDASASQLLLVARAASMIAQGRTKDAAEQLAMIYPRQENMKVHKQILDALVLVTGDDVAGGVEIAVKRLWESVANLDAHSIPGYAYVASLGMYTLGRFDEIEAILELTYRLGDSCIFQSCYKAGLFMIGSFVAGWQGRAEYVHSLVDYAKALNLGTGPFPGMFGGHDISFSPLTCGDKVWDAVDDLLDRGFLMPAVYLAMATVRPGDSKERAASLIGQALNS
ncbi:MAG: ATP-binding protein, partial [Propionibacteriaceae bacterium]|nr:ATP-binding protein [Propionibacteriaceae bacterium]